MRSARRPSGRALSLLILLGVAVLLLLWVAMEGNLTEGFLDLRQFFGGLVRRYGVGGSLSLLYVEESGVPLPIPGDVYVVYLGHLAGRSFANLALTWLAIIAVVTAGSTNLFLIGRRYGRRILEHRLARVFHLDAERLETARRWFQRRGVLAIIFGRHIPGFRVPLTFVAATLGFPYRRFVPSVAISTGLWAGAFLLLGDRLGRIVGRFLGHHSWIYAAGTLLLLGVFGYFILRASRIMSEAHQ